MPDLGTPVDHPARAPAGIDRREPQAGHRATAATRRRDPIDSGMPISRRDRTEGSDSAATDRQAAHRRLAMPPVSTAAHPEGRAIRGRERRVRGALLAPTGHIRVPAHPTTTPGRRARPDHRVKAAGRDPRTGRRRVRDRRVRDRMVRDAKGRDPMARDPKGRDRPGPSTARARPLPPAPPAPARRPVHRPATVRRGRARPHSHLLTSLVPTRSLLPVAGPSRRSSPPVGPRIGCSSCRSAGPRSSNSCSMPLGCASRSSRSRAAR